MKKLLLVLFLICMSSLAFSNSNIEIIKVDCAIDKGTNVEEVSTSKMHGVVQVVLNINNAIYKKEGLAAFIKYNFLEMNRCDKKWV